MGKLKVLPPLSEDESKALYKRLVEQIVFDIGTGCWLWTGKEKLGYGYVYIGPKVGTIGSHRAMWYAKFGDPGALDVLHNCNNKACINFLHLHLGTHKQNFKEASEAKLLQGQWKTHCKRGHPLSGDNLLPKYPGKPWRGCKTCHEAYHKKPEYIAWRREYQRKRRADKRALETGTS